MAYDVDLLSELVLVHPMIIAFLLKMCISYRTIVVLLDSVGVKDNLSYKEVCVEIIDYQICKLRNMKVFSI